MSRELASSTLSKQTLQSPIVIEGYTSPAETKEAFLTLSNSNVSSPKRAFMLFGLTLMTALSVYALSRKTTPMAILLFALCVLVWMLLVLTRALLWWNLASLRKNDGFEKIVRGEITNEAIRMKAEWPTGAPQETFLSWNDITHVRYGKGIVLLCLHSKENDRQPIYHLIGRGLFRSEADWHLFRELSRAKSPELKLEPQLAQSQEIETQTACARCLKIFDASELGHVPIWVRWVYPPLWIPAKRNRYCSRCKRSMSSALFFIIFMIIFVGGMLLFLPKKPG